MTDEVWRLLAERAGLGEALARYPDDVKAAATAAATAAFGLMPVTDPAAEPWPPMRVRPA